jgi:hypothetical protein
MSGNAGFAFLVAPAVLAGAAAAFRAAGAVAAARALAVAAIAAAIGVAVAGPTGTIEVPTLLVGAVAGIDRPARAGLVAAAMVLGAALWRDFRASEELGWRALLASGLAVVAVAFDAGMLAVGLAAAVFAAYGLHARGGRERRRAAAAYAGLAMLGQVLLVDALAELGHAAATARLDVMRDAALEEVGDFAVWLFVAAFGLPLSIIGTRGPAHAGAALAVLGGVAVLRVTRGGPEISEAANVLGALWVTALLSIGAGWLLARRSWRVPRAAAHEEEAGHEDATHAGPEHGAAAHGPPRAVDRPAAGGILARLGSAEARLAAVGASGVILVVLAALLGIALALVR